MSALQPPKSFEPDLDPAVSWEKWKQKIELYWTASELDKANVKKQRATLLHILGDYGLEIYNTLEFTQEGDDLTVEIILEALSNHFKPYANETYTRFIFFSCNQKSDQSIDEYVTELKQKASDCNFKDLRDSLIRDRIVCGMQNNNLRERLLSEKDLSLTTCVNICRADEKSRQQVKIISNGKYKEEFPFNENHKIDKVNVSGTGRFHKNNTDTKKRTCFRCNMSHDFGKCTAWGKVCGKCKKFNHFATCCKARQVRQVEEEDDDQGIEEVLTLDTIVEEMNVCKINKEISKEWTQLLRVYNILVDFKLDTGSQANILPSRIYKTIDNAPALKATTTKLLVYNKNKLNVLGVCELLVSHNTVSEKLGFYILEENLEPILGLKACVALNLIKRVSSVSDMCKNIKSSSELIEKYADIFQGVGCIKTHCTIRLQQNYVPSIARCRKLPLALHEPVKKALDQMERDGIVTRVEEATEWVNAMVVTPKKDGSVRLCMDPRPLNKYIIRQIIELPTFETIISQIGQAKWFSVLDASCAFWQIPLDDKSSDLCTFITPFARYKFNRLPYGLSNAPEIFQNCINNFINGLEGTLAYMDDILIYGNDIEEHNERLEKLFSKARQENLRFKKEKLQLALTKVSFLGHTITSDGIKISEEKIRAIKNMNRPTNVKELQCFLGMVNYLSRFIPNISRITAPLRDLLKKDSVWIWEESGPQEKSFKDLKNLIITAPVLCYFDPKLPVTLSTDASQYGLGGHISQNEHPIAYWSMSLNNAQRNYAQIEKELLSIVLACEHFHYYLYGRPFIAVTDHKPLLGLINKPIDALSPRLQRLVIRLMKYSFTLTFLPGKELYIPDSLSRAPLNDEKSTEFVDDFKVNAVLIVSDKRSNELLENTNKDPELQAVKNYIRNGWPNRMSSLKSEAKPYYQYRDEIHEQDGFLFKGNRLIIPRSDRLDILDRIHSTHQGIISCQKRALDSVFWPFINEQIVNMVSSCLTCLQYSRSNSKQPLHQHPVPALPWQKVGIDFAQVGARKFLVVCDYHSKFIELIQMSKKDASSTTDALLSVFKSHGLPQTLMSDNGPPFDSMFFRDFCVKYDIIHITSSPRYSQSNGLVERHIETVKGLLIKNPLKHPYEIIMEYNSTSKQNLPSPSEMLMGRKFRTLLPCSENILRPKFDIGKNLEILNANQQRADRYYNIGKKPLTPLVSKQPVVIQQDTRKWIPGKVLREENCPDSYIVQSNNGGAYRRNRIHLRPIPSTSYTGPSAITSNTHTRTIDSSNYPSSSTQTANAYSNQEINRPVIPSQERVSQFEEDRNRASTTSEDLNFDRSNPTNVDPQPCSSNHSSIDTQTSSNGSIDSECFERSSKGRILRKPVRYKDFV